MKQLGLGMHSYHDARGKLPPGNLWQYGYPQPSSLGAKCQVGANGGEPNQRQGSALVLLLPYVEGGGIYDKLSFAAANFDKVVYPHVDVQQVSGVELRKVPFAMFACPSDITTGGKIPTSLDIDPNLKGRGFSNYVGNCGHQSSSSGAAGCVCSLSFNSTAVTSGFSNGAGCANPGSVRPAGVFARDGLYFQCRLRNIPDGISKTIMVGETRVGCDMYNDFGWSAADSWGKHTTLIPLNFDSCISGTSAADAVAKAAAMGRDACAASCNFTTGWGYKSRHPGIVQFLMCDGAVVSVSENIDPVTLNILGCRADGRAASLP